MKRLSINKREIRFLGYFLPLFVLKLLDITAEGMLLPLVGIFCLGMFVLNIMTEKYSKLFFYNFSLLLAFSILLVITCGKQGIFFSVVMLLAMKDVDLDKNIYKVCLYFGILFLVIACLRSGQGGEATRYIDGEWTELNKRSNLLYVSFAAVVSLYVLIYRFKISWFVLFSIFFLNEFMYSFVGSRTGYACVLLLIVSILFFKIKRVQNSIVVKYLVITSPIICTLFCFLTAWNYGKYDFLEILNMMLQGRVYLSNAFLDKYGVSVLGQHIAEGEIQGEFWCLDSAYMDMIISEGLVFTVLWLVITCTVIKFMYERKRFVEVSILIMYTVYGISETFLPNCFLNISIFLYGEYIYSKSYETTKISLRTN